MSWTRRRFLGTSLLMMRGHQVVDDIYADEDIERFAPEALRAAYDLIVFPGHTEYHGR